MKIDYNDFNIKKIYYAKKEFKVEQFYSEYDGIKLYFDGYEFLDEFGFSLETREIDKLHCINNYNQKITLFNVCFSYIISSSGRPFIHLLFEKVIYAWVNNYELQCNKLKIVFDNEKYLINNFFEFNNTEIKDNIVLTLGDNYFLFESSEIINTKELYNIFIDFYDFFNLLCGFFPAIKLMNYYKGEDEYRYVFNVVEKYITKRIYIKNDLFFTLPLNCTTFLNSYNLFIQLRKKAELSFDIYYCSMMQTNVYPEFAIVNLLQSFDGLFSKLTIFKDKQNLFEKSLKKKLIERYCNLDISDICGGDIFDSNRIRGLLGYINKPPFSVKIEHMLNVSEKLFESEKKIIIDDEKKYFDILLKKFVNTRNKFSHSTSVNNDYLDGTESALYIMKLFLAFRICVMKEIGIKPQSVLLNEYIQKLNVYFNKKLQIFGSN